MNMHEMCPNCLAIWGFDEIERGRCFSCGWPDLIEEYEAERDDYDDDDFEDFDQPTCMCSFCNCGMPVSVPGDVCNDCRAGTHQG